MGNRSSNSADTRRHDTRRSHHHPAPEITSNRYMFAAATPYSSQYPNPNPPQYYQMPPGYYPPPMMPLPAPYGHHHRVDQWVGGRMPCGPVVHSPVPCVEHQKAVTIRNDVNLKKETLRVEVDQENPGMGLVSFTFDATVAGSITVIFFANEGENCDLIPTKGDILPPVTVHFEQGLGQKFRQPSGSGINFSMFEEKELMKEGEIDVYPLAVKAESFPANQNESDETKASGSTNSQITQAVFEKDKSGEYHVRVVKQILYINGKRYELQEIYGIGNSVDNVDANDPGKECVICLSEPRDTTVLPCRHMCMCSGCAKVLRFQTTKCPICRQPVERLLEIKVNNASED